MGWFC